MTLPGQSYTYEMVRERVAILDAPFTCHALACDEALPAPPAHDERRAWDERVECPRCGSTMSRAPFARAVAR